MHHQFYKILLIEDSSFDVHIVQSLLLEILGIANFSLTHSPLLKMSIEILKDHHQYFDLIISDLSLPDGMDPEKNIQSIAQYGENIPILVLSGFYDQELFERIKKYQVINYFVKGEWSEEAFKKLLFKDLIQFQNQKKLNINKKKGIQRLLLLSLNPDLTSIFQALLNYENIGFQFYFEIALFIADSQTAFKSFLKQDVYQLVFIDIDTDISARWIQETMNNYAQPIANFSKIIIMSNNDLSIVKKKYKKFFWDDFLKKPFNNLAELYNFIQEKCAKS